MIIITSIAPVHLNDQKKAVDSWNNLGFKVYSLNNKKEIEVLKGEYKNVNFVETSRTMEKHFDKPVVQISAMLDFAKTLDHEYFLFVNSDIELTDDYNIFEGVKKEMQSKVIIANRQDYGNDKNKHAIYHAGIDMFFIHKKFLNIYPQSMYACGQCFWDYWIPFTAMKSGIDIALLQNVVGFHHKHELQYSHDNWFRIGRFFRWENLLYQFQDTQHGIGQMSTYVHNLIYKTAIKLKV